MRAREVDVDRIAAWLATRAEGERNRALYWAACRLAENGVPDQSARNVLGPAAEHAGLHQPEILTTIRSAYRTVVGLSPFRSRGPHAAARSLNGQVIS